MFLEAAIGDAYGSGFEFTKLDLLQFNDGLTYRPHPYWPNLKAGMYTDDTQMSIAVAETMLSGSTSDLDFANAFVAAFHRDPREGYSKNFFSFIKTLQDGSDLLARVVADKSSCGSAMRSLPLGYLQDINEVVKLAEVQSKVTHNNPIAINAAKAIAVASHFCLYQIDKRELLREFVADVIHSNQFNEVWDKPITSEAHDVVCACFTVFEKADSIQQALIYVINLTGDVDTVASLAAGLLSNYYEVDQRLIDNLEDTKYGKSYIKELEGKIKKL